MTSLTHNVVEGWVLVPRWHVMYWLGYRWRLREQFWGDIGSQDTIYSNYRTNRYHAFKELEKRYDVPQRIRNS